MAEIAKAGTPSMCSLQPPQSQQLVLKAGEALGAGDACYVKADGLAWKATGAAANAAARVDGFAAETCAVGEAVTLWHNVNFRYGSGLTPGARYFLSGATAGGLADAATTGGTAPVAFAVDTSRIHVLLSRY